jgi:hypothetical protein
MTEGIEMTADSFHSTSASGVETVPGVTAAGEPEPVGEVVLFGDGLKEVSWRKGKMPPPGTKLYAAAGLPMNAPKEQKPHPELSEAMTLIPCAVTPDGWLWIPHADDKWVTGAKLQPFSQEVIRYWLAEQTPALALPEMPRGELTAEHWRKAEADARATAK